MTRKELLYAHPCLRMQHGVALAIVLWFIAGMSLLVAGIVAHARVDTQMAQIHVARAKAVAAGDGAIQLMMVDLMTTKDDVGEFPVGNYRLGDVEVSVALVPAAGLIDLNGSSLKVLSALFLLAGGLGEEEARLLAENVVQSRIVGPSRPDREGGIRLNTVEDMLRVPGASRTLLDAIRDFIVVNESGNGETNWSLAPDALRGVVELADPAKADAMKARGAGAAASFPRSPGSRSRSGDQRGKTAGVFRADAIVLYGDKTWLRRCWISTETNSSAALPWHIIRTEPARVLMKGVQLLGRSADA